MTIYTPEAMYQELQWLADNARHVTIVPERLNEVAVIVRNELELGTALQTDPRQFPNQTLPDNDLDTLQFYLILASQHFCIWRRSEDGTVAAWDIVINGERYVGGRGINAALIRALRQGKNLLSPDYLATMTFQDIQAIYEDERTGQTDLQMLPQRLAKFNEIGRVLRNRYQGHVANLLERAEGCLFRPDGEGLVQQLMVHFPLSFFDWPFNKLAILYGKFILIRNWADIPTTSEFERLSQINDLSHFAIAADYYIPLFFIRTGVFEISPEFATRLKTRQLIERNSRMEMEFRACTMVAGRLFTEQIDYPIPAVDEIFWRSGFTRCRVCNEHVTDVELPCPYRDLSVAYQTDHELMRLGWPLVLTTCY